MVGHVDFLLEITSNLALTQAKDVLKLSFVLVDLCYGLVVLLGTALAVTRQREPLHSAELDARTLTGCKGITQPQDALLQDVDLLEDEDVGELLSRAFVDDLAEDFSLAHSEEQPSKVLDVAPGHEPCVVEDGDASRYSCSLARKSHHAAFVVGVVTPVAVLGLLRPSCLSSLLRTSCLLLQELPNLIRVTVQTICQLAVRSLT